MTSILIFGQTYSLKGWEDLAGKDWTRFVANVERSVDPDQRERMMRASITLISPLMVREINQWNRGQVEQVYSAIQTHLVEQLKESAEFFEKRFGPAMAAAALAHAER